MKALVKHGKLVDDPFVRIGDDESLPDSGAILVSADRWQRDRSVLLDRGAPIGILLKSDQSPEAIAGDLERFVIVALEFPQFRDGRAYSYARMLRERFGFQGEIRAVGDVLMDQLHFMLRTGFDAFELGGEDPVATFEAAKADFTVWYQPTGDGRATAIQRRHRS